MRDVELFFYSDNFIFIYLSTIQTERLSYLTRFSRRTFLLIIQVLSIKVKFSFLNNSSQDHNRTATKDEKRCIASHRIQICLNINKRF